MVPGIPQAVLSDHCLCNQTNILKGKKLREVGDETWHQGPTPLTLGSPECEGGPRLVEEASRVSAGDVTLLFDPDFVLSGK